MDNNNISQHINKLFICIVITMIPLISAGQVITLTEKVTGAESEPIPGVNIYIRNPLQGTTTNSEGAFNFTFRKQSISYNCPVSGKFDVKIQVKRKRVQNRTKTLT